jgi:hypothetical protein
MNLIFAKTREEAAAGLKRIGAIRGSEAGIIPLMPKAALELHELGLGIVELPIDMLSRDEREAIGAQAIELSKSWCRGHEFRYMGVDLLDCCRLQMLGFFQDLIAAEMLAPLILDRYSPSEALFFRHPSVPSFGHSMHDGSADVFEAVLQWRMSQAGIRVDILPAQPLPEKGKEETPFPSFARRAFSTIGKVLRPGKGVEKESLGPRRFLLSDLPEDRKLLVGFGAGYDLPIIWPYLKHLSKETGAFPVLIDEAGTFDASTLRSGLTADPDLRCIPIADIPLGAEVDQLLQQARQVFFSALDRGNLLPRSMENPLLRFQYQLLWDALIPQALYSADRAASFFSRYPVLLYLDDNCAGPSNRAWVAAAKSLGVPTAIVQHGALNLLEFFEFTHDWALTQGELGGGSLQSAYPDLAGRIVASGDPSMERIQPSPISRETGRNQVVLLTGGFLHQAWTDMDLSRFLSTWKGITGIAESHPNLEFLIKPHPSVRDLGYWYKGQVEKSGARNIRVIEGKRLEDMLSSAILAVLVGKPGTAGLVTILQGVPFVYLDAMLCRSVKGYGIWVPENGVPRLAGPADLAHLIDELEEKPEARHRLLEQNKRFSRLYLASFSPRELAAKVGLPGEGEWERQKPARGRSE